MSTPSRKNSNETATMKRKAKAAKATSPKPKSPRSELAELIEKKNELGVSAMCNFTFKFCMRYICNALSI